MSSYDYNHIELIGHLGKKPEIKRQTGKGSSFATVSIAINERWTKDGIEQSHTDWFDLLLPSYLVSLAENSLEKGSHVQVVGKVRNKKWQDKEGKQHFSYFVAVKELRHFDKPLEKKNTSVNQTQNGHSSAVDELDMADIPF